MLSSKNQQGFTLMELLIVVSVIAVLTIVSISIIDPTGSQGRARDGVRMSNVNNLSEGIESYRQIEGAYPLDSDPGDPDSLLMKTYLKGWPKPLADDGTLDSLNWSYKYAQIGDGFILYSPTSRGTCYKYQTTWHKLMECPEAECTNALSLVADCN